MQSLFSAGCRRLFQPIQVLGHGGGGVTVLAIQESLGRPVVIKLPRVTPGMLGRDAAALARFRREARYTAALSHAHIVVVVDQGIDDDLPWIAYEYLPGRNLQAAIAHGPLAPEAALEACWQVALALEHAHASEILHRDIKPSNVMEAGEGRYKLIDFGLAQGVGRRSRTTLSEGVVGTPAYVAPERIEGRPASPATEVYSLGATLYELLTGRSPFRSDGVLELLKAILEAPVPRPSDAVRSVPAHLDRLVQRAMAKDPSDRFATMQEFRQALEAARGGVDPRPVRERAARPRLPRAVAGARTQPLPAGVRRGRRRLAHRTLALAMGMCTAAAALFVPWSMGAHRAGAADAAPRAPVAPEAAPVADELLARAQAEDRLASAAWVELGRSLVSPAGSFRECIAVVREGLAHAQEAMRRAADARAALAARPLRGGDPGRATRALHAAAVEVTLSHQCELFEQALRELERAADRGEDGPAALVTMLGTLGGLSRGPRTERRARAFFEALVEVLEHAGRGAHGPGPVLRAALGDLELVLERAAGRPGRTAPPDGPEETFRRCLARLEGERGARLAAAFGAVLDAYRRSPGAARQDALGCARRQLEAAQAGAPVAVQLATVGD